jgi:uncharacterized protein (DUF433 family)
LVALSDCSCHPRVGPGPAGRTVEDVLADYPYRERADVLAALEFAAATQEREVPLARPV